jgi:hypothetical protein
VRSPAFASTASHPPRSSIPSPPASSSCIRQGRSFCAR